MSLGPDLSLPPACPALGQYGNYNWDDASFALYTLIDMPASELEALACTLDAQRRQNQDGEGSPLVRVAPAHAFSGKSLKDIVSNHVAMDKDISPRDDGAAVGGDLHWYPTAFVVVTTSTWESGGLLFVYCVDDEDEAEGCPMDKFFFCVEDAHFMLSSISFGDESCAESKTTYAIGEGGQHDDG